jgi:membrane fusion protein, heavy metal efflux system
MGVRIHLFDLPEHLAGGFIRHVSEVEHRSVMKSIYFQKPARNAWQAGAVLALTLCAGCHRHDHPSEHAHEPRTAQITVWGERHEVFTEHLVPVAGEPVRFVTHVTDLQSAQPRAKGLLVHRLRRENEPVLEHIEPAPTRPGIYEPALTFPSAGRWQVTVLIPDENANFEITYPPITVFAGQHDADHAEADEAPDGISFLKEQQWNVGMRTEPAATRRLVQRVQVIAQTRARPGLSATVTAPVAGRLAPAHGRNIPVPGTPVCAGDILGVLKPQFSEAAARLAEVEAESALAEAALKQAEAAHARIKGLVAADARSPRELEEAELALASARARLAAAGTIRAMYASADAATTAMNGAALELRAPIDGILTSVSGTGQSVLTDQVLFTVLNPQTLWIEAQVPEAAIERIREANDALVQGMDRAAPLVSLRDLGGTLVFSGLEVHPVSRTVPLIYEVANHEAQWRVGQQLRLHIETQTAESALAIQDSALVEEGGLFVAFVQLAGETFDKRELRLGIRDGEWIQVLSGIAEGERVVTKGAYAIRLAAASAIIPAHSHTH